MLCKVCGKEISEDETYTYEGKRMCEECAKGEGLFPLGHTGLRRDKIVAFQRKVDRLKV
jgi:hypothetical protein